MYNQNLFLWDKRIRIPMSEIGRNHTDAGSRIMARVVDSIIDIIAMIPLFIWIFNKDYTTMTDIAPFLFQITVYATVIMVIMEVVIPYYTKGQTLGKKALGIRMVELDCSRVRLSTLIKRYGFQWFLNTLSSIPGIGGIFGLAEFIIFIVSVVFIFNDPNGQAVWDKVAGTIVLDDKKLVYLRRKYYKQEQDRKNQQNQEPEFTKLKLDDNRPIFKDTH